MNRNALRTVVLGTVVVGALALLAWRVIEAVAAHESSHRQPSVLPVPVAIALAERRTIAERVTLTGVIRPHNEVDVFTKVGGRVEEVRAQVGGRVEAGQVLAVIEHRELILRSGQAQAQLQAALAGLEQARTSFETAAAASRRSEVLRRENAIPEAEFERTESAYRDTRAGVMAAEAHVATARAAVSLAEEAVGNSRITTPIAGRLTRRLVNVGATAAPGTPLFQVQDVAVLKLESAAPASDFARLRPGQDAKITVSDLPGAVFHGRVSTLSPSLDPQTRRAAVEITISNPQGRLLPNMFGQAVLEVARKTAIGVPENALVSSPSGRVIFVVRDGKAVELKPRLGGADAGFVAVDSGLAQGERVVVAGYAGLRNGAPVRTARP
jgi:RND family efflux transporter MFP subunit